MRVSYPEIEGATPIKGFVDANHDSFSIAPGKSIEMPEESARQMKINFRFLELGETQKTELKPGLEKESGIEKFQRLKKEAKAAGIDTKGMNSEDLENATYGE